MDEQFRRLESIFSEEYFKRNYGVHRWQMQDELIVTAISQPTWLDYLRSMDFLDEKDQLIVSPELMTASDLPFSDIPSLQEAVETRIKQVISISNNFPLRMYLLGTPTYIHGEKPKNSVLYIQAGSVVGKTHKRSGATIEERQVFDFNPE